MLEALKQLVNVHGQIWETQRLNAASEKDVQALMNAVVAEMLPTSMHSIETHSKTPPGKIYLSYVTCNLTSGWNSVNSLMYSLKCTQQNTVV